MGIASLGVFPPSFFAVTLRLHEKGNSHLSWVPVDVTIDTGRGNSWTLTRLASLRTARQRLRTVASWMGLPWWGLFATQSSCFPEPCRSSPSLMAPMKHTSPASAGSWARVPGAYLTLPLQPPGGVSFNRVCPGPRRNRISPGAPVPRLREQRIGDAPGFHRIRHGGLCLADFFPLGR